MTIKLNFRNFTALALLVSTAGLGLMVGAGIVFKITSKADAAGSATGPGGYEAASSLSMFGSSMLLAPLSAHATETTKKTPAEIAAGNIRELKASKTYKDLSSRIY